MAGPPQLPKRASHWRERFYALMPYRVRDVLLVSSAYDAFLLEEDGPLTHQLFTSFSELNLSWAPRLTHVATAAEALSALEQRTFQLVVTVPFLKDASVAALSARIREQHANLPIILLVFDAAQLDEFPRGQLPESIDEAFLWSGDAGILIAIVKLIEDQLNVEHDVHVGDVQVIGVVEDDLRAYSSFLSVLYPELLRQSRSLVLEGLNEWHRALRIHARPKIVLAKNYEQALFLRERWGENLMGVISDVSFPRGGREHSDAGLDLARALSGGEDAPPVLLQSSASSVRDRAIEVGAWFVDKKAPDFMTTVRRFLTEKLGFGEFVFVMPDGTEVARASNVFEMAHVLETAPADSIVHHARRHDFSRWLKARSMFQVARHTRGILASDFDDPEMIRRYLRDLLYEVQDHEQDGVVTDVAQRPGGPSNRFVRVGAGSIGGKGRSIGFISRLIVRDGLLKKFPNLEIRIPKTVALSIEEFDKFIERVGVNVAEPGDDAEIRRRIMETPLSDELIDDLRGAVMALRGPLAVRSSSLLEDARFQPFAGVYATYMLPNNHEDPDARFAEVERAIRGVYASMFDPDARTYAAGRPRGAEDEKMAVVIQQVVGQRYEDRFYPHISGVAQSYNYYPIGHQRAADGVAVIALGLGQTVVGGGGGLRFCPRSPTVLPQFPSPRHVLQYTQRQFYALDLSCPIVEFSADPADLLVQCDLATAERDGTLALAGSVYSPDDDAIRENLALEGPRVVTFANVLRWRTIPLAEAIAEMLGCVGKAMGGDVEIEFAVDMADWGKQTAEPNTRSPRLYILQARPMASTADEQITIDFDALPSSRVLCRTEMSLGNGRINDLHDIVFVRNWDLSSKESRAVATEIEEVDARLGQRDRSYLLIGPGRWGSSDPGLGIPVRWLHISHARVIAELPLHGEMLESSQGTHFFHNVTVARLGYLTITPEATGVLDREWLEGVPAASETPLLRHIELEQPLAVYLDGRRGRAAIVRAEGTGETEP